MASARSGVAATPPSPMRARLTTPSSTVEGEGDGDAGDVVEAALGDLVEGGDRRERQRDPDRRGSARRDARTALAVAGEVVGERHLAVAHGSRRARRHASRASSTGGVSPIGEPVPRLPPIVAPLRIRRDANCGQHLVQQRHPALQPALDLGEGQGGADLERCPRSEVSSRSSGRRSMAMASGAPGAAEVDLDAPVGGAGDQRGVGVLREQGERLGQVGGADELARRRRRAGCARRAGAGSARAGGERVVVVGLPERVRGVADRAVAGAAAEVAAQRVQVEAVRSVLVVGGPLVAPARRGRTRRPCCRRSPACSSRTATRRARPSRCCTGCSAPGAPRPSAVTTSWPSSAAPGPGRR